MSEVVDLGVPKETAIGPLVAATAFMEDRDRIEEAGQTVEHGGSEAEAAVTSNTSVPDDEMLKPYYCGAGPCHPSCLQVFANKKFFTFLLCVFAFVQGSLVSGELGNTAVKGYVVVGLINKRQNELGLWGDKVGTK